MTILSAEQFDEFERYLENPTITPEGAALIHEAVQRETEQKAKCAACPHADCCRKRGGLYR